MSCLNKGCVVHCSKLTSMRINKGNHGGKFAPKGPQKMKHQSHWIIRLVLILFKQMVTSGGHFAMLSSLMTVSQKSVCCFYLRKIACIFLCTDFMVCSDTSNFHFPPVCLCMLQSNAQSIGIWWKHELVWRRQWSHLIWPFTMSGHRAILGVGHTLSTGNWHHINSDRYET